MQALKHYNARFDNTRYQAVTQALADDLRVDRESLAASDAANLVTDAALEISGHTHYTGAWVRLATFCGQNAISIPTIDAIYNYLLIYQQMGDNRAEDFELTAKALLKSYEAMDTLKAAVCLANGVHGWRGRASYDLLAAADYFTQAAGQLLQHGEASYIREKLTRGEERVARARKEFTE